eukprot:3790112-Amphidinium_carterae.1
MCKTLCVASSSSQRASNKGARTMTHLFVPASCFEATLRWLKSDLGLLHPQRLGRCQGERTLTYKPM